MKIWILALALLSGQAAPKPEPFTIHVKEVHREEEKPSEKGTWFRITATMESRMIIYNVKCEEFWNAETEDFTAKCCDIAAGKDYNVVRAQNALNFWLDAARGKKHLLTVYSITSEREK
jgi:hypothetical protein